MGWGLNVFKYKTKNGWERNEEQGRKTREWSMCSSWAEGEKKIIWNCGLEKPGGRSRQKRERTEYHTTGKVGFG